MNVSMLRLCKDRELIHYLRDEDSEVVRLLCDRMEMILDDYINPDEYECFECKDNEQAADSAQTEIDEFESQIQRANDIADELFEAVEAKDWERVNYEFSRLQKELA